MSLDFTPLEAQNKLSQVVIVGTGNYNQPFHFFLNLIIDNKII